MIEDKLLEFGIAGIFILYLMYDKQIMMKKIVDALDRIGNKVEKCDK